MFLRIHIPLGRKAGSFVKFVVAFSPAEADLFGQFGQFVFVIIPYRRTADTLP